jgi:hypothetical protein
MDFSRLILEKYNHIKNNPSAYTGIDKIYIALKREGHSSITKSLIKKVLSGEKNYYIHKYRRKKVKTARVVAHGIDEIWCLDTANLSKYSRYNKGIRHLLIVIDTVSKYLFVKTLPNLLGGTVTKAFEEIVLKSGRKPGYAYTDSGTEFLNVNFKKLLKTLDIHWYRTGSSTKSSLAERVIRTLKEKIYKHFTKIGQFKYIDILPDLVDNYNNSVHSSTLYKPESVNENNEEKVLKNLYKNFKKPHKNKFHFKIGQTVVVSKELSIVDKGYKGYFNKDIYIVHKVLRNKNVPMYILRHQEDNDILEGAFYNEELQTVERNKNE